MPPVSPIAKLFSEQAIKMVEEGRLPPRLKQIAEVVERDPHEGLLAIVEDAVFSPDKFTDSYIDERLATPASPYVAGRRESYSMRLDEFARSANVKALSTMSNIVGDVARVSHMSSLTREAACVLHKPHRNGGKDFWAANLMLGRTRDSALETIGRRVGRRLFDRSNISRSRAKLIPLTSSTEFLKFASENLDTPANVVDTWRESPLWKGMAVEIFAGMLPYENGYSHLMDWNSADRIKESIALKERWFEELMRMGVTTADIERSLFGPIHDGTSLEFWMRTLAELRRYAPGGLSEKLMHRWEQQENLRIDMLAERIRMLHEMDQLLKGDEFVRLLPPLLDEMTFENIIVALSRMYSRSRHQAQNQIRWHDRNLERLADYLAPLLRVSFETSTLEKFCYHELAITPDQFWRKVRRIDEAGIEVRRIVATFEESFPYEIAEYGSQYPESQKWRLESRGMGVVHGGKKPTGGGGASSSDCSITNVPLAPRPMGFNPGIVTASGFMAGSGMMGVI